MADFQKPDNASLKSVVLDEIEARATDIATDSKPTNPPEGYVAFDSGLKKWVKWLGGSWVDRIAAYAISITGNAATANKLATPIAINDVNFDGSAAITVKPYINNDETTNATRYLVFTNSNTAGYKDLSTDGGVNYNPSTNTAGVNISGNAATATNAANANTLDGLDSTQFVRSDTGGTWGINVTGNAANANTLDGLDSTQFVRSDTGGTWGINVTGNAATATNLLAYASVIRLSAISTGNDPFTGGVELLGGGSDNILKPSLGFHQPNLYAGSLQQENYELFRFYKQDGQLAKLEVAAATATNQAINFGQVLGIGQTWQDVKASRACEVTYTNTTGKPILISISLIADGSDSTTFVRVNGTVHIAYASSSFPNYANSIIILVPNGSTYSAHASSIVYWYELR